MLNLGVEGMMLVGAVMGFWAVQRIHAAPGRSSLAAAVGVAALAGAAMALIHAFLVITLRANQIVSGLALTIFAGAAGLSSYLGNDLNLAGAPARAPVPSSFPPSRSQDLPVVGPIVFGQNVLVYASWACVVARRALPDAHAARASTCARSASRRPPPTRWAINVAALPLRAHARRRRVRRRRRRDVQPRRSRRSGSTASRGGAGWIAIALVIFAFWRPTLCLVGAYFFGAFSGAAVRAPGHGVDASRPSSSRRCRT